MKEGRGEDRNRPRSTSSERRSRQRQPNEESIHRLRLALPAEGTPELLLIGALAVATVVSPAFSMALLAYQEVADNTFQSGSIALGATKVDALALTTSGMMPGDEVTDDVVVENDGMAELRYSLSTSSTDPDGKGLGNALKLTIKGVDVDRVGCGSFDGTLILAETTVNGAALGTATVASDTDDRTVAVGSTETLCVRLALPLVAGDGYQNASTTTTFTFHADENN